MRRCASILLIIGLVLSGCTTFKNQNTIINSDSRQLILSPFDQIIVKGKINVNLWSKPSTFKMSIHANNQKALSAVKIGVKNRTLMVDYPSYLTKGAVEINIYSPTLRQFKYHGKGTIQAKNMRTKYLQLFIHNTGKTLIKGAIGLNYLMATGKNNQIEIAGIATKNPYLNLNHSPKVKLSGIIQLSSLTSRGCGWLSLYWLKSNSLKLKAYDRSYLQLAGVTQVLDAELWDNARFNGQYLRAQRAFVKTHQASVAQINTVNHQYTLALDNSNIYFYNHAVTQNNFFKTNGAVLDMSLKNTQYGR